MRQVVANNSHIFVPGVVGFFVAMTIAWLRWPEPSMHDDFGSLLVASTLLEGRLTNPVPAAWQSMETFHVVFQPTYASKYPIGLGSALAIGKILFGTFAAGLWLCAGLASASIGFMISSHFPRRWAMAAGLMTATHPFWQNGWSQEFTNGWLTVSGTALVLGGLLRIRRSFRSTKIASSQMTGIVGLGCVLTMYSRPFEGGLVCGLLGLYFLPTLLRRKVYRVPQFWIATLPGMAVLASGVCFQLVINHSITGHAGQLPYQLHESQYGVAPVLIFQQPHEPTIGHRFPEQVKFHHGWSMNAYNRAASFTGYFDILRRRMKLLVCNWGNMLAAVPFGLLFLRPERRRFIGMLGIALIALLVINCIPWTITHYVSPLIPIAVFLVCCVAKGVVKRVTHALKLHGRSIQYEYAIVGSLVLFNVLSAGNIASARYLHREGWEVSWAEKRAEVIRQLEKQPTKHIVFVQYPDKYDFVNCEWVFNEANLEKAGVIWVRWGTNELNQRVIESYPDRTAWLMRFNEQSEPILSEFGL